jgi:hypothetical protein
MLISFRIGRSRFRARVRNNPEWRTDAGTGVGALVVGPRTAARRSGLADHAFTGYSVANPGSEALALAPWEAHWPIPVMPS